MHTSISIVGVLLRRGRRVAGNAVRKDLWDLGMSSKPSGLLDGNGFRANPVATMVHDTVPKFDRLLRVIDVMDKIGLSRSWLNKAVA
jgi:hypothetical protein